jgi:hypothetical protein
MVVVGTWNLENLFRPGSEFGPSDEPAYEAKLAALAGVIDRLAPDVLAVQEVGDPEALADLADSLDGDWETGTSTVFDAHHPIRVGVLSRLPLSDIEQPSQFPAPLAPVQVDDDGNTIDAMVRGALRVRVAAGGQQLDIVTCHLKSKLLSFPGGRFQPTTRASAPASQPMHLTGAPLRRSPCAPTPTGCSTATATSAP